MTTDKFFYWKHHMRLMSFRGLLSSLWLSTWQHLWNKTKMNKTKDYVKQAHGISKSFFEVLIDFLFTLFYCSIVFLFCFRRYFLVLLPSSSSPVFQEVIASLFHPHKIKPCICHSTQAPGDGFAKPFSHTWGNTTILRIITWFSNDPVLLFKTPAKARGNCFVLQLLRASLYKR